MERQSKFTKDNKRKKFFEDLINSYNTSVKSIKDLDDLYQLAIEENNKSVQTEILENINNLRNQVKKDEINVFYLMILIH